MNWRWARGGGGGGGHGSRGGGGGALVQMFIGMIGAKANMGPEEIFERRLKEWSKMGVK